MTSFYLAIERYNNIQTSALSKESCVTREFEVFVSTRVYSERPSLTHHNDTMVSSTNLKSQALLLANTPILETLPIDHQFTSIARRQRWQCNITHSPLWHLPPQQIPSPTTCDVPPSTKLSQPRRKTRLRILEIPKLWFQRPRTAHSSTNSQTHNITRQRRSRTRGPPMTVRNITLIITISSAIAISKTAIGEISFNNCASRAIGVMQVPTPTASYQVQRASSLSSNEMSIDFKGRYEG